MPYLVTVNLLWAFSFSLIGEYLAGRVDSDFAVLVRVAIAALVFIPFTRWRGLPPRLVGGLWLAGAAQALTCGPTDGRICQGTASQYAGGFNPGVGYGGFGGGSCTASKTPVVFIHGNADSAISFDAPPGNVSGYATPARSVYAELKARGYNDCELFGVTYLAFGFSEANDGVTGRCSSHFGKVLKDNYFMNHLDITNQVLGLVSLFETNPKTLYQNQANRLKNLGL